MQTLRGENTLLESHGAQESSHGYFLDLHLEFLHDVHVREDPVVHERE